MSECQPPPPPEKKPDSKPRVEEGDSPFPAPSPSRREERFAFGHHYFRPHETHHSPSRKFYHNELFRVPLYEIIPLEAVVGTCCVLDLYTYCKGELPPPLGRRMLPRSAAGTGRRRPSSALFVSRHAGFSVVLQGHFRETFQDHREAKCDIPRP